MRSAPPIAVAICVALTMAATAQQAPNRNRGEPARDHYIEFRARSGGILGHTFVVYGRTDRAGRVLESHQAGLYPADAYAASPMLPVALVPGYVTAKREDPGKPLTAVYRRRLSANEYAHLQATMRKLKVSEQHWHMVFYNCNDFAAQIARELGMIAPHSWSPPGAFVNSLAAMNGR